MNFDLSDDQRMLVDTVASFVKKQSPVTRLRGLREDAVGWQPAVWQQLGDRDRALAAYRRVMTLAPKDALVRWRAGELLLDLRQPDPSTASPACRTGGEEAACSASSCGTRSNTGTPPCSRSWPAAATST